MDSAKLILDFDHDYDLEVKDFLPTNGRRIYFPSGSSEGGRDGLIVCFSRNGEELWTGIFSGSYESPGVVTAVISCPDANAVCVVVGGCGYYMQVDRPEDFFSLSLSPILGLYVVNRPVCRTLVGHDYTKFIAIDGQGPAWTSEQVSVNGIRNVKIVGTGIRGIGWDPSGEEENRFEIDISSGRVLSGRIKY